MLGPVEEAVARHQHSVRRHQRHTAAVFCRLVIL